MDDNQVKQPTAETSPASDKDKIRKTYHKPSLDELGDLRTLTLGGSPFGPGDTGPDNYYPL